MKLQIVIENSQLLPLSRTLLLCSGILTELNRNYGNMNEVWFDSVNSLCI